MKSALLPLLLWALPAAAGVTVKASLNKNRIAMGEEAMLSVKVSGDQTSLPSPQLPAMQDFSLYEMEHAQTYNLEEGRISASVISTYVLTPRAVGRFRIPPITAAGASPSAPIDVEVLPAGQAPPPSRPAPTPTPAPSPDPEDADPRSHLFLTASLSNPSAYVNEQTILTVRLYYDVPPIGNVQYKAPALSGFLTEDLPPTRKGSTTLRGRPYGYFEVKTALFPLQPGAQTIGPAQAQCQIPSSSNDFFGFFGVSHPVSAVSPPVPLRVRALPEGRPADFTGVVGRLSAKASLDRTEVKAGDAVTLTVSVSGTGNIKSLPEPARPNIPSLRFFETESSASVDKSGDRVGGTKTFRTVVVPRVSGQISVPAFSFSYFDPERKAYQRAETAPIVLRVSPGATPNGAIVAAPAPAPGLTAIGDDIRYLKIAARRAPLSASLAAFAGLGPWHALPFALLLIAGGRAWRRRAAEADPRGRRFRDAYRKAEERLRAAAALPAGEAARAAALVDEALVGFAADKLGVPAAGLTLKTAIEGLRALPAPPAPATLERLKAAWEEAALRRFAPGGTSGGDPRGFAEDAAALLKALDAEVRR